jgi:hypothetical protein
MMGDHDYTASGFDAFLSRSIDNVSQINLESQGPASTAIRYDSAQVSGSLGDTLQIGGVNLNGSDGNIELTKDRNKPLLIGKDSKGNEVVKVAKEGYDARTARDDQLVFNSDQNVFKIVKSGQDNVGSASTINWTTIPHNLGYVPAVIAFLNDVGLSPIASHANIPLPTYADVDIGIALANKVTFGSYVHAITDITNLYLVFFNATGSARNFLVKWYLLQESAN